MPVKCLINCVNLMPSHRGSWRGLEQGSLRDYYLSGSYGNCRPMERRGKTKQQFSPTFPQGLENSPPKTLRISHSSHSFGYWLSICSETSQRVFRMIYFSRGRHAISKQLKIVGIFDTEILVDAGGRSEGILKREEITAPDGSLMYGEGDTILVMLE